MKINMNPNYWVFLKQKQGFFYVFAVLICFFFKVVKIEHPDLFLGKKQLFKK